MTLRSRPATDAEYWVVTDERGRIVAQGSKALCQEVERDGPLVIVRPEDLFDCGGAGLHNGCP